MKIIDVTVFGLSVPVPEGTGVRLGAGRAVKRRRPRPGADQDVDRADPRRGLAEV